MIASIVATGQGYGLVRAKPDAVSDIRIFTNPASDVVSTRKAAVRHCVVRVRGDVRDRALETIALDEARKESPGRVGPRTLRIPVDIAWFAYTAALLAHAAMSLPSAQSLHS